MNATEQQDKTYNGWTNYETWAVGMYLGGNYDGEGTYLTVLDIVRETVEDAEGDANVLSGIWTLEQAAKYRTAETLKEWFAESLPEVEGITQDLLRSAVDEVNWDELAESKLTEISET